MDYLPFFGLLFFNLLFLELTISSLSTVFIETAIFSSTRSILMELMEQTQEFNSI
jgi:hypothetical protein